MKKLIQFTLTFVFAGLLLSACSTTNTAMAPQVSRTDISGNWRVTNVSLQNFPSGYSVGHIFDMADYQAFEGSVWDLKGGGTGTITLTNGMVQPIYWSINKSTPMHTFQFKKLDDGQRPKDVSTGYSVEFGDVTKDNAVIKTPVNLSGGQTGYVNLSFVRQ